MRKLIILGLATLAVMLFWKTTLSRKRLMVAEVEEIPAREDREEQLVYLGLTGTKYHTSDCPRLGESRKTMNLADAVEAGYGPCKFCMS
jgi:hypothetical protein